VKEIFSQCAVILKGHTRDVLEEFLYLALFGLMPVWLGGVIHFISGKNLTTHLNSYLYGGEALLISTAFVGPLIYLILKEYGKTTDGFSKPFPGRNIFVITIISICLVSAAILTVKSVNNINYFSKNILWYTSALLSTLSLIIWLFTTLVKNALDYAAPAIMRENTEKFVENWQNS